jgi:hypothetical protein
MMKMVKKWPFLIEAIVDVLVAARGIPSWTTFLREEENSRSQKEDH